MQVKKFEAKNMKEALELVKVHLGPEAIILSARDTHRGFGLMGERSVEVTAAVSEETLRKKKIAELKLKEELREKFQQIPASKQKQFIDKVFKEATAPRKETVSASEVPTGPALTAEVREQVKGLRYIDIEDEAPLAQRQAQTAGVRRAAAQAQAYSRQLAADAARAQAAAIQTAPVSASRRVSEAAAAAASAALGTLMPAPKPAAPATAPAVTAQAAVVGASAASTAPSDEVRMLESQVRELKALVERFQNIPQIPMSMHPGAEQGLPFELSGIYQRLTGQGVQPTLVTSMLRKAQREMDPDSIKKPAMVDAWVVRHLLNTVQVSAQPTQGRYHVFMGSTGQGKTTSLVKFASHLIMKEKRTIAIISLDTLKVGAADQLRIYAQILNVPFAIVRTPEEWRAAEQKLKHVQHILVDCPGFSLRTMEEADWLKRMIPPADLQPVLHYVQSILARDEETIDIAGRYQMLGFNDVIFTRLDESSRQGLILNFQERFSRPVHSFGMGTRIPEDYEFATKERVVDFLFKLSKVTRREDQ